MFKSGFQPVCVLYQGNQSPFDGSCQLVCRHQIQETQISQGDTVTVVDFVESQGSSNEASKDVGPVIRQAIVMGQEMVSSLIGAQFQTKQSEEPEEISLLRGVFAAVKVLNEEVSRQARELSHMKQRQIQMMNLLDAVCRKQDGKSVGGFGAPPSISADAQSQEEEEVVESGPIIASVRSTFAETTRQVQDEEYSVVKVSAEASSPVSEQGSETFEEDLLYSAIKLSPGNDHGWEQDQGSSSTSPVLDKRKDYLELYVGKWRRGENVEIGNFTLKVMMPITELEDILYKTNNATSFGYRLAGKCFTSREMVEGNTRGGGFRTDGEIFKQLNPDVVEMILGEVKKRFPFSASDELLARSVRNAINERARNERKRIARYQMTNKFEESPLTN
ncbi:uncharacterized protein LOC100891963 isoform X2 [Strongylocentrotus purpuratus]|uniref:BEN domain-containing protein n=1 Tax=Strongylocentrotus purpuratus TaxID=7668 RepID=A0A7M7P6B5_STRPU|nr:uncharacterized protein LOC100891963 isoform X2 [Strongylocentrotus purpuratus]